MSLQIGSSSRYPIKGVPFLRMKDSILGKRYSLSIAFVTPAKIKSLNIQYRKHNESTDILSFGLGEDSGELYFSMSDVARKARTFNKTTAQYFKYLVVHGLLHLKGHVHGKEMDALEKKYCKQFGVKHLSETHVLG